MCHISRHRPVATAQSQLHPCMLRPLPQHCWQRLEQSVFDIHRQQSSIGRSTRLELYTAQQCSCTYDQMTMGRSSLLAWPSEEQTVFIVNMK